jgi:hypothetical protein
LAGREIHYPQAPGEPAKRQYPDLRSVPCSASNRHAMQSDARQRLARLPITMAVNSKRNWRWCFDLDRRPGERAPLCLRFSFGH